MDAKDDLDAVADEVYGADPRDFVRVRRAAADDARAKGDRSLAKRITALRKPTLSAWAVDLLVRADPGSADDLTRLGDAMRAAQSSGDGPELRSLSAERARLVTELTDRVISLAADRGRSLTESAALEVRSTLTAAIADPDVARQVRAGHLTHPVEYSGFGPAAPLTAVPERRPEPAPEPQPASAAPDDSAARAALADAEQEAADARNVREAAEARVRDATDEVARLRTELDHAEHDARFARAALTSANEQVKAAERAVREARAHLS
ncbi:hypothetical protein DW322_06680 [Rhodococcus rhodnii]|uniref:Uncharacterized protein n=2 Tax=Rhodococcus rhodnii TaxID=38312 RepID=R7WJ59_9NOCA|nr:hypothetical protein [Rhodococcus rhodnii]EOM75296.1 hypothetical protein Rrhod_3353 [Rhodococcus rhodnii LMG 5362]TXG89954.1 hypothetical protein DW322_06680 [Rhodococcus rhodnii]